MIRWVKQEFTARENTTEKQGSIDCACMELPGDFVQ